MTKTTQAKFLNSEKFKILDFIKITYSQNQPYIKRIKYLIELVLLYSNHIWRLAYISPTYHNLKSRYFLKSKIHAKCPLFFWIKINVFFFLNCLWWKIRIRKLALQGLAALYKKIHGKSSGRKNVLLLSWIPSTIMKIYFQDSMEDKWLYTWLYYKYN